MNLSILHRAGGAVALLLMSGSMAMAAVVGIGTTNGGANAAVGAAIAKVVSENAGFQMRPQKMGGSQQYIPVINAGKLEFGLSNAMQYGMAVEGSGLSEGEAYKNLRLVATLMEFRNGVVVGAESGINSLEDLKGKRIPSGFESAPLFEMFMTAFLASAGLDKDDVQPVPVVGLRQSWDALTEGKVDAAIIAAGAGPLREMNTALPGGVKYIPLKNSDEALKMLPRTRFTVVEPDSGSVALREPTLMHVYEYVLFAGKDVADDVVYEIVRILHERAQDLKATGPFWNTYFPENIATDFGFPYHPGAVKYFNEKGL